MQRALAQAVPFGPLPDAIADPREDCRGVTVNMHGEPFGGM